MLQKGVSDLLRVFRFRGKRLLNADKHFLVKLQIVNVIDWFTYLEVWDAIEKINTTSSEGVNAVVYKPSGNDNKQKNSNKA